MTGQGPLLTWLHLSDLHFGHGPTQHSWDQVIVLDTLRATVEEGMKSGDWPPIDLVLVTGDIAFSGGGKPGDAGKTNDEYQRAAEWLTKVADAAGLGPEAVYMVPGNHDVDRGCDDDRNVRRFIASLRAGESIDEALAHPDDREMLCDRQERYLEFARSWAPPCGDENMYWSHRATAASGLRYRFAGINTALLCADDQDHGKLAAGNEQFVRLLVDEPIAEDELVIVLSHHPLTKGWLVDEKGLWNHIRARAHLHLSGHLHQAHSEWSRTGAGDEIVTVVAGAAHDEAKQLDSVPATHGFNLASIVPGSDDRLAVEVRPFRWSRNRFVIDVDTLPSGSNHVSHRLRQVISPQKPIHDPQAGDGALLDRIRSQIAGILDTEPELATTLASPLQTNADSGSVAGAMVDSGFEGVWSRLSRELHRLRTHFEPLRRVLLLLAQASVRGDTVAEVRAQLQSGREVQVFNLQARYALMAELILKAAVETEIQVVIGADGRPASGRMIELQETGFDGEKARGHAVAEVLERFKELASVPEQERLDRLRDRLRAYFVDNNPFVLVHRYGIEHKLPYLVEFLLPPSQEPVPLDGVTELGEDTLYELIKIILERTSER
jgi:3',5'-cyclic AMP phosphodiesterase CpdA